MVCSGRASDFGNHFFLRSTTNRFLLASGHFAQSIFCPLPLRKRLMLGIAGCSDVRLQGFVKGLLISVMFMLLRGYWI